MFKFIEYNGNCVLFMPIIFPKKNAGAMFEHRAPASAVGVALRSEVAPQRCLLS